MHSDTCNKPINAFADVNVKLLRDDGSNSYHYGTERKDMSLLDIPLPGTSSPVSIP
jgi:hypothetical protein